MANNIQTLNDINKGGVVVSISVPAFAANGIHSLLGKDFGGGGIVTDVQQIGSTAIHAAHDPSPQIVGVGPEGIIRESVPLNHAKLIQQHNYVAMAAFPSGCKIVGPPVSRSEDDTMVLAPKVPGLLPPKVSRVVFEGTAEGIDVNVRIVADPETADISGVRVHDGLQPWYGPPIIEVCPQNEDGTWISKNLNGFWGSLDTGDDAFGSLPQKECYGCFTTPRTIDGVVVAKLVLRVGWHVVLTAPGEAPTSAPKKDANCCFGWSEERTSIVADIHKALYDPDAVEQGGGRVFEAAMRSFAEKAEDCSDGSGRKSAVEEDASTRRKRTLEAAERRAGEGSSTTSKKEGKRPMVQ